MGTRPRLAGSAWLVVAAQFAVLLATSTRYGYHRDELYFIVAGSHPAFGYPDQPPLVPLVCWAMHAISGSLVLLRLPSAIVSCATTLLAALIARELGGERRAQLIAAGCTAASGFALAVGHFVTTTSFDLLSTTALGYLLVCALVRRSGPHLLAAGLVVGIGCEAKPQIVLVAAIMLATLLAVGPRWPFRTWWLAAGIVAAAAIAAPYVAWQAAHGWPQLTVAHNIAGSSEGGRAGFVPFQLVMVSPVLVPVWIAGLLAPFRRPGLRTVRFVSLTYPLLALTYIAGNGKAYYLASLYPLLLGIGALPVAEWMVRTRLRAGLLVAAVVISATISAVIALPLLPERSLQGSAVMALNPDQGETVGWPRFVRTIERARDALPARVREQTAIFTENYGEAAAIDILGAHALPRAYSGHNGFSEWGEPPAGDTNAIVVGYEGPRDAAPEFVGCRTLARIDDGVGLDNDEQGLPVQLCRPSRPWSELWLQLRHFN